MEEKLQERIILKFMIIIFFVFFFTAGIPILLILSVVDYIPLNFIIIIIIVMVLLILLFVINIIISHKIYMWLLKKETIKNEKER
jgi:hypothetical protein